MAYKIKKNLAHRTNYGQRRNLSDIRFIVYHYTANDGDHDEGNGNFFHNNANLQASAHEFVDDDSVTISVPHNYIAWHCGSETGYYKSTQCRNYNSIGIEMCDTIKDGKHNASEKTRNNAIARGRKLAKKYGIPESHIKRHFDITGKLCPLFFSGTKTKYNAWKKFRAEIYYGYRIGKKYELQADVAVRKSCGGKKTKKILKKGTDVTCKDMKFTSKGTLYMNIGDGKWIICKTDKKVYVK